MTPYNGLANRNVSDVTCLPATGLRSETHRSAHHLPTRADLPPELAEIADAWPGLPEPVKAGILAMVRAAQGR